MKTYKEVYLSMTAIWYWVKEDSKVYKTKGAAEGRFTPAYGDVKPVIEHEGKYYVKYNNRFVRIG